MSIFQNLDLSFVKNMEYTDYAVKVIYKKQADCINKKWTNDNILRKNDNILRKNDNILRKNDNILQHVQ